MIEYAYRRGSVHLWPFGDHVDRAGNDEEVGATLEEIEVVSKEPWWDKHVENATLHQRVAAVEASEWVPADTLLEVDADGDTAFELGRVAGYDEAMREQEKTLATMQELLKTLHALPAKDLNEAAHSSLRAVKELLQNHAEELAAHER